MRFDEHRVYLMAPVPRYPAPALAARGQGRVTVTVRTDTLNDSVWISATSRNALLDSAALDAMRQVTWRTCSGAYDVELAFQVVKTAQSGDSGIARIDDVRRTPETGRAAGPRRVSVVETTAVKQSTSPLKALVPVPDYPDMPLHAGIEGSPTVALLVRPGGSVDTAWLAKSSGNQTFDQSAVSHAKRTLFVGPGTRRWKAPVRCAITYEFAISRMGAPLPDRRVRNLALVKVKEARLGS